MFEKFVAFLGPLGWLIDPITKIAIEIRKTAERRMDSKLALEHMALDERLETLRLKQQVLIRDPYAPLIRLAFALPFIIYNGKLILWDKVFELGTTDPLSPELIYIQSGVIAFYFLKVVFDRVRR